MVEKIPPVKLNSKTPIVQNRANKVPTFTGAASMTEQITSYLPHAKTIRHMENLKWLKGEIGGILITALGTGLVAPIFIGFNPFTRPPKDATPKQKEDFDNTKKYTAMRQPISAVLAILFQASVQKYIDKGLDKVFNNKNIAKYGSIYVDQQDLNTETFIKSKIKKQMAEEGIEKPSWLKALFNKDAKEARAKYTVDFDGRVKAEQKRQINEIAKKFEESKGLIQVGERYMDHKTVAELINSQISDYISDAEKLKKSPEKIAFYKKRAELLMKNREHLEKIFAEFSVKPDYDLNIMKQGQTLDMITTSVLNDLGKIIDEEKPDIVLVHGDTTTSFAGALAAFYHQTCIGHVEAGLRTWNKQSPYPEEMNRQMVDSLADLYFAPTKTSKENLLKENKDEAKIFITGNTAIDAMTYTVRENYQNEHLTWASDSRLILLTAHRRENIGDSMRNIFRAIKKIVEEFEDVKVIYPIHLNPKVRSIASEIFQNEERIRLIEPLEVVDFHNFIKKSYFIMSDSGGVQEEAPHLGKPVLVLRDTTERPEGVEANTLKLVGTNERDIYENAKELLTNLQKYKKMANAKNPYGDGTSSQQIVSIIEHYFQEK